MRRGESLQKRKVKASVRSPASQGGKGSRVGDLEKRLAEPLKREAQALEQQTATSEILLSSRARRPTSSRCSTPSSRGAGGCSEVTRPR